MLGVFPKGHQWMSLAPRFVHRHRPVTYYERYVLQWVVCPVLSHAVPLLMTSVLNFPFAEMFFCWFYLVANFLSVRDSSYVIGLWPSPPQYILTQDWVFLECFVIVGKPTSEELCNYCFIVNRNRINNFKRFTKFFASTCRLNWMLRHRLQSGKLRTRKRSCDHRDSSLNFMGNILCKWYRLPLLLYAKTLRIIITPLYAIKINIRRTRSCHSMCCIFPCHYPQKRRATKTNLSPEYWNGMALPLL